MEKAGTANQYYDAAHKASWRAVLSDTKITASALWGLAYTHTWSPTLTVVIRANGDIERGCNNPGFQGSCD